MKVQQIGDELWDVLTSCSTLEASAGHIRMKLEQMKARCSVMAKIIPDMSLKKPQSFTLIYSVNPKKPDDIIIVDPKDKVVLPEEEVVKRDQEKMEQEELLRNSALENYVNLCESYKKTHKDEDLKTLIMTINFISRSNFMLIEDIWTDLPRKLGVKLTKIIQGKYKTEFPSGDDSEGVE